MPTTVPNVSEFFPNVKPPPEVSSIFDEKLVVDMEERTFKKENGV